ncbi:MAG TPA: ABC transporter substrate-binding protein [Candidatus Tectomicrobia bacterium]|nr:ABC transporter substrate-binding protein [Candidatus Tectomicrobia bacterium]
MPASVRTIRLIVLLVGWFLLISSHEGNATSPTPPAGEATSGGTYRRTLLNNPPTLDPSFVTEIYGRTVVSQMFDGLVRFDANLKPIPAIAEFWEASRDVRTWTFHLRRGVMFHHGREVTAQDFVYSFTRLLRARKLGPLTELLHRIKGAQEFSQGKTAQIEGLQAVDRYTLQIKLGEPFAPLLAVLGLANAAVVPPEAIEGQGEEFGRAPVGTGPFKFVRWEPNQEIVLAVNEHYYRGRPFLDRLVYKIGWTFEKSFEEFLRGNLEETVIPSEQTDAVRTDPQYRHYQRIRKPRLSFLYIGFNTQFKPFDDKRVRQAFNYAVNREAIVREITKMGSIPATGTLPPGMPGYDPTLQGYYYNPVKAKQLLAEAGYPNGVGFPVVQLWTVTKADSAMDELTAYQQHLADLGVQVELHVEPDWPRYREMLTQGKIPMFRLSWTATIPDPDDFLSRLLRSSSPNNRTFYHNPRVDQLLDQARSELDETQRIALYHEVESIVMDDAPWITQHYHVFERLFQPYVKGVEVSLLGDWALPLAKVWLAKSPMTDSIKATSGVQPH